MNLDNSLTEGITMMWKVDVDILLFDSTKVSLYNDRMHPTMMVCWNWIKGGVNECSRVLNNHKPPFHKLNGYTFVWFRLAMSGE